MLWLHWWNVIGLLCPAFSRLRTFMWFATAVAGMTVRTELLGVTSLVRALSLQTRFYDNLLDLFHSSAVKLDRLAVLWTQAVLRLFPAPLLVNGRRDGIKLPKCGKKMPAVKLLHQQSDANTQPEYLMGHSLPLARSSAACSGTTTTSSRARSNAVAYSVYRHRGPKKRGRPRRYGEKVKLRSLLNDPKAFQQAQSPIYGEHRGACLLMCTDVSLNAIEIIRLYGLRFKIEHSFKQAVRTIGAFAYRFWMQDMKPLRRRNGNQYLHRESLKYRQGVKRKIHAYHVFMQAGVVAQGLLQYLAVAFPTLVWSTFGSWLRTIRPGIPPSEFVVASALRHSLPNFLLSSAETHSLAKFITERQDTERMQMFRLAS